ncbi:hypothetical protein LAD77_00200 [Klebsiella pneumoniae]|nr:hypothetical protein [Klebsiella pneumoniae]
MKRAAFGWAGHAKSPLMDHTGHAGQPAAFDGSPVYEDLRPQPLAEDE